MISQASGRMYCSLPPKIACCNCTLLTDGLRSGHKMAPFPIDRPNQLEWYFSHLEDTEFILLGKEF